MFYDNQFNEDNTILETATCIFQSETNPLDLIEKLPKNLQGLTLIQGFDSGNKTIKFSSLQAFPRLTMLTLKGAHPIDSNSSKLICEIDKELPLKYLDFDRILLKNIKTQIQILNEDSNKLTFEYVQRFDPSAHPLTLIRKGNPEKIVPYSQYKEQENNELTPLFNGFEELILLRIYECGLNQIHWQMFEGLHNLVYLNLEKNNLRFIPDFAFYGVPNLNTLSLAQNNLLNIQITDLAGLLELEFLDLSHNNFSQLSELSLPPFPKLKLANFADNPISVVFPNTFEVMNTTESIVLGSEDTLLSLLTNSFVGLKQLKKLTLRNLKIAILKREIFTGIPNLQELILSGNIPELEFDAFVEVKMVEKLILAKCNICNISMDAFLGLDKLKILDLSKNQLEFLSLGVFDDLTNLQELYLSNNKLRALPKGIFSFIHPKLIRMNSNPWHCSCEMSHWKPIIMNRIKQKIIKPCDFSLDKGVGCLGHQTHVYKYIYENKISPRCSTPKKFSNWSIFHAMRKGLKCSAFKPKFKKNPKLYKQNSNRSQRNSTMKQETITENQNNSKTEENQSNKITLFSNYDDNDLNINLHPDSRIISNNIVDDSKQKPTKYKKIPSLH